jgi:iron complex outermembrane recepter protein
MKLGLASTALSLSFMLWTPAHAQQAGGSAAPGPADANSSAPSTTVADVIVTAQRRSENLQRVALAVSAVSGEALESANVTKPSDLSVLVPSLQTAAPAGPYTLFYLRGRFSLRRCAGLGHSPATTCRTRRSH